MLVDLCVLDHADFHSSEVMAVSLGDIGGQGEVGREPLDSDKVRVCGAAYTPTAHGVCA